MAVEIDAERVLRDLYGLRKIGAFKTGVHRPTLSADDMTTRRWLAGTGAQTSGWFTHRESERGWLAGWCTRCHLRPGSGSRYRRNTRV